jgi:hypothetical protein
MELAKKIESGKIKESKEEALKLYEKYPDSIILLNLL